MNQTDNILRSFDTAPDTFKVSGMNWYRAVHDSAIARGYDVHTYAGVMAALSPNMPWDRNVMLADKAMAEGGLDKGTLPYSIQRTNAIINGANPLELLNTKSGHKTFNFYLNISNPDNHDAVTIDRHAFDIATGVRLGKEDRGLSSKRRYYEYVDYYRNAADKLGILPQQLQAVTWEWYRSTLPTRRGLAA